MQASRCYAVYRIIGWIVGPLGQPLQGFLLFEGDDFVRGHGPTRLEVVDRLLDRYLLLFIIAAPFYFDA